MPAKFNWYQYMYSKSRRQFGSQLFLSDKTKMLLNMRSNYALAKNYILKDPVDRGMVLNTQMGLSECNTENVNYSHKGMNHIEGGWPNDINFLDEEQTVRYRKNIERDDRWGPQVLKLTEPSMHAVLQNNVVNIYQDYFEELGNVGLVDQYEAHELNIIRDEVLNGSRCVKHLSWNEFEPNLLLGTYGPFKNFLMADIPVMCYIWDLERPNTPMTTLKPPNPATIIEFCPKDHNLIAGGLQSGQVAIWDMRTQGEPVAVTPLETMHRAQVTALCFVHSRSNTEFYTGSTGGGIRYWDTRFLNNEINGFLLDPNRTDNQRYANAHGCTVLTFEYTIPIRYLAGTDHGFIFCGNRKGIKPTEALEANFQVMSGPVKSIERNPTFLKNFLVIGDWCSKIWTEECKNAPLFRTKNHTSEINCGTWSKTRCSLYFTGNADGSVHLWDLTMDQFKPIQILQQFKSPVTAIQNGNQGRLLAVGNGIGNLHIYKLDEGLTHSSTTERVFISSLLERQIRRVKLLAARKREIKLKMDEIAKKQRELEEQLQEPSEVGELGEVGEEQMEEELPEEVEEEHDQEWEDVRNKYFESIAIASDKILDTNITMQTPTAFDATFNIEESEETPSKISPEEQIEKDHLERMEDLRKLMMVKIENRKKKRKSHFPKKSVFSIGSENRDDSELQLSETDMAKGGGGEGTDNDVGRPSTGLTPKAKE